MRLRPRWITILFLAASWSLLAVPLQAQEEDVPPPMITGPQTTPADDEAETDQDANDAPADPLEALRPISPEEEDANEEAEEAEEPEQEQPRTPPAPPPQQRPSPSLELLAPEDLFEPIPPEYPTFGSRLTLMASYSALNPVDSRATFLTRGDFWALHGSVHLTQYQVLDVAVGYFRSDFRRPLSDFVESVAGLASLQLGGPLPDDLGRWYVAPGVGYFLLDEQTIGEPDDIAFQAAVGAEFASLKHSLRTRIEGGYVRLSALEEDFLLFRLGLAIKF